MLASHDPLRWAGCSPRAPARSRRSTSWRRRSAPPRTGSTRAAPSTISGRPSSRRGGSPTRSRRARAGSTSSSTRSPRRCGASTALLASTQQLIARAESGESAVGVLLSRTAASPRARSWPRWTRSGGPAEKPGRGRRAPARAALRPGVPVGRSGPPGRRPQLPRRLRAARPRRGPARRPAPGRGRRRHGRRPGPISAPPWPTCAR